MAEIAVQNVYLEGEIRCQVGVKKASIEAIPSVTPDMLKSLRLELSASLAEFGVILAQAIDKDHLPYSRQYISRLEHGKDRMTPELVSAFYNIAAVMDEVPAGIGGAVTVSCMAQPGQGADGAFIPRSAKVLRCATPGCSVMFVRTHPRQRYHDPDCRRAK